LGRSCTKHDQCNVTRNSICVSNVCICRSNHFAYNEIFCIPVLDQVCSKNSQCSGDFFHCSNNKCQCRPGFTAVSVDKCVRTISLFSCRDETECSDIWHSTCSTEKCVCKSNNIAVGNSTCLPILRGYCWRDDQCKADNSACINYWCECKPGFVEVAMNSCAPIIL
ncbi:GSCOCG00013481001-RA-CDS, partial [Cotesia congregata]